MWLLVWRESVSVLAAQRNWQMGRERELMVMGTTQTHTHTH